MLHIVWGSAHAPHTRHLLDNMVGRFKAGASRQILLVPEPFSHQSERMLCELGGDAVSLSCEVLTFKRLAHRVLLREGGLATPQLDSGGRLLMLSRALELARPQLTHWGRKAAAPRFLEQLIATLDELKSYEVDRELLSSLPGDHPSGGKLRDLRIIWEAFDALCAQSSQDPRDLLSRVADLLENGGYARGVNLYINGFVSFTAQEHRILRAFLRHAEDITICITGMPDATGEQPCWEQPRKTAERLVRAAAGAGRAVTQVVLSAGQDCGYAPALRRVETYIMSDDAPGGAPDDTGDVLLFEARDPLSECECAARLVRGWADNDGIRYRDMAIAVPSWDTYGPLLESACLRHGLPLFSDSMTPLSHKAAVRFVTAALRAALHNFPTESLIALLKTGLTPLTPDETYMLEDYLRVHAIRGTRWSQGKPWTAHPGGWGRRVFSARDSARLDALNAARERLRVPLSALRTATNGTRPVRKHAAALYEFCEAVFLPETLAASCKRLEGRSLLRQADECRQLWGFVCRALDGCVDILGDVACSCETFEQIFSLCVSQYQIGVIPVALDRLHAGPFDRLRVHGLSRLVILGAAEPFMPGRTEASGLLTDEERILLEEGGANLAPGAEERASRELLTLYRCFSLPRERLAVCRPRYLENAVAEPSLFFTRLRDITGAPVVSAESPPERNGSAGEWLSDRSPVILRAGGLLPEDRHLSPSRIQTYQTCRFQYFMRYGLRARLRPLPGPQPSDAGLLIHAALDGMVTGVMAEGGFRAVSRERAIWHAARAADAFTAALPGGELQTARAARLLGRLRGTALTAAGNVFDELSVSDFSPLATELPFDAPVARDVFLRGVIDRVDGLISGGEQFVRVADYKSGRTKFSFTDIRHGLGIQLLCYLFALNSWDGQPAKPAGALYLPAHDRYALSKSRILAPGDTAKLQAGRIKADGLMLDAFATGSKTASPERFGLLRRHVESVMRSLADGMRGGGVEAKPVRRGASGCACDFCDFKQACLFDETREQYKNLSSVSKDEFWKMLETEGGTGHGN